MPRHHGGPRGTRPRYRRISAAASAVLVTLVAVLGGIGLLPTSGKPEAVHASTPDRSGSSPRLSSLAAVSLPREPRPHPAISTGVIDRPEEVLPERSGHGKRIVFDMSEQRVWLVSAWHRVRRTYPVSGSLTDNLDAGTYEVYSKSINAIGVDDSGTMKYMVRFAHGRNAAIGFHDIPVLNGKRVQSVDELGTPQSHGCIRQRRVDAKALWDFAPVGTTVVVVP